MIILIKVKLCKGFGAFCDNGDCIFPEKICDGVFDCTDFSDEHLCKILFIGNPTQFISENKSCIIQCDKKCIPFEKICNHFSDCEDGSDEFSCGKNLY